MKVSNLFYLLTFAFLLCNAGSAHSQSSPANYVAKTATTAPDISGLPVIRIKATAGQSDYFAIMFSGDGGWSKFDQGVCDEMAAQGISTLGLNCLKYIWDAKTPEQMTTDLTRLIERGEAEFRKQKVILIGYSCGANLAPFAYNRLNDTVKAKVQYMALLSPEKKADFRFHFYNWANSNSSKAQPVKPELEKMRNKPALFIYGEEEDNTWCADLMNGMFQLKKLPGGHHFNQDTRSVAAEILHFKI